ncbi:MAG: hypothetical protein COT85_03445 [Chlamydiae bacterium CG10_big_fil_rev_8_21_14_0_10_42_34]|nr:MAG: hypothetical protein COT85_03445 [Chlamydiae bacterium CG10_big_fil_rev_8_21_14_0_10_42_34]
MLSPFRLGAAGGIVWGACMFICTVLAIYTGYSKDFLMTMMSIYPGYDISWGGAFLGLVYGFFDAFIGLMLLAWFYNKMGSCKECSRHHE